MRRNSSLWREQSGERGSALLIVFVFAAIVAIMLYKAIPGVVFEAQRQKEQLLIDRGNEYKRGIKLFYIHNKTYPTSLDQLDNFNNLRYIRHRFKDPMTGKKDWRLIHVMGPGFVLTDSKVTPPPMQNQNGQAGSSFGSTSNQSGSQSGFNQSANQSGFGQSSGNQSGFGQSGFGQSSSNQSSFGQSSQSSFGQSGSGQNASTDGSQTGTATPLGPDGRPLPTAAEIYGAKRRPAPTADAYMGPKQNTGNGQEADGYEPLPMPGSPNSQQTDQNSFQNSGQGTGQNPGQNTGGISQANNGMPPGGQGANSQQGAQPGANNNGSNGQPASAGLSAVNSALRQPGQPFTRSSTFGSSGTFGSIPTGAIAGVASTAEGSSIKKVDKQTDYAKWEFVYNPQKEATAGMAQAMQPNSQGMNPNASSLQPQSGGSGFGSSNTSGSQPQSSGSGFGNSNSGFGSSGSSGSSFGNSSGTGSGGTSSGFGNSSSGFGDNSSANSQQRPN